MNRLKFLGWGMLIPLLLILSPGPEPPVLVMTFNIRYGTADDGENSWKFRKESLFHLIRAESPQLLGLQEALRFQLDEIRSACPQYGEAGRGRDDGMTRGEYAAILYDTSRFTLRSEGTFWFSPTPSVPGSIGWGNTITRICTWAQLRDKTGSQLLNVYNLHLDHESQQSRQRSVQALLDTIRVRASKDPVIVTGDFNAGERNQAVQLILSGGFSDTYRTIHPGDSQVGTYHAFNGSRQGEKIDYIFVDSLLSATDASILRNENHGKYPSDHFPVTARIQLLGRGRL